MLMSSLIAGGVRCNVDCCLNFATLFSKVAKCFCFVFHFSHTREIRCSDFFPSVMYCAQELHIHCILLCLCRAAAMWIQVRTMDGKETHRVDSLSKLTKVDELRVRIMELFNVEPERQRLFYRGKQVG